MVKLIFIIRTHCSEKKSREDAFHRVWPQKPDVYVRNAKFSLSASYIKSDVEMLPWETLNALLKESEGEEEDNDVCFSSSYKEVLQNDKISYILLYWPFSTMSTDLFLNSLIFQMLLNICVQKRVKHLHDYPLCSLNIVQMSLTGPAKEMAIQYFFVCLHH